jgi:galactokinase
VGDLQGRLMAAFDQAFGGAPDLVARAPGRVNLIGEHTDYNNGWVLPMAIGCETRAAARRRGDGLIRLNAADLNRSCEFRIDAITPNPAHPWSNYVRGVVAALIAQGVLLTGADLAIAGDVPQGAGLSSSASLEVALGLALAALAGQPEIDRTCLALAGQSAEHHFAGCQCGIMDQLVSARAEQGAALLIDCASLQVAPCYLANDLAVMIVHSGVSRGLVEGEYNTRRGQCEAAARYFGATSLREVDLAALAARGAGLDPVVLARARHVVTENARVLCAADALQTGDLAALGELMTASHASLRDDFQVTIPAVDALVELLQRAIGAEGGARMTGGGFGGAVVAVLPASRVAAVRDAVRAGYRTPAGATPLIMVEQPQAGASLVC